MGFFKKLFSIFKKKKKSKEDEIENEDILEVPKPEPEPEPEPEPVAKTTRIKVPINSTANICKFEYVMVNHLENQSKLELYF